MSFRNTPVRKTAVPALSPPLSYFPIKPALVPSLSALCIKGTDIGGTSKRKANGELAATRLGSAMTEKWANERFRQVMLLIRQFRMEWPNKSLLTADDTEFIRTAVDVALTSAGHEEHTGDIYDLNSTTWAIWMVQHVHTVRHGAWTAESEQVQFSLTFENLYDWLETQHARGDRFDVKESGTGILLNRYKLPFKAMTVPPKKNELFKWKKGAKRLSDWMEQGGFAPIDPGIRGLEPAKFVAPPPLQSQREATRAAIWGRVAARARVRQLTSVERDGEDASLTRGVVSSVMEASRTGAAEMTDAEADVFTRELEEALEEEPQQEQAEQPQPAQSHSQPGSSDLSEYELTRLENIARNRKILQELGLQELQPPRAATTFVSEEFPPGRSGAEPSRRSTRQRNTRNYAEKSDDDEKTEDTLKWTLEEIEEAADADD